VPNAMRLVLQVFNYAVFMGLVWYFATSPPYRQLAEDQAVITLAFSHAGERREECRRLSQEELAKLPPNMRLPMDCPRERSPIKVELFLDDELAISEIAKAPGLYQDQGVDVFRKIKVPVGKHDLRVRMNDNVRVQGPTFTHEQAIELEPAQLLVVDFKKDMGKFIVR